MSQTRILSHLGNWFARRCARCRHAGPGIGSVGITASEVVVGIDLQHLCSAIPMTVVTLSATTIARLAFVLDRK
jgi:hypothetical protein